MDAVNNATEITHTDIAKTEAEDFIKQIDGSGPTFSSYGTPMSTDGISTLGSQEHENLIHAGGDHNTLPVMEEDSGALLVSAASAEEAAQIGIVPDESRQTITLSLDAATQYLLQQQGITTQAIEMDDGTYQLFEQPLIQVQREDGTLEAQTLHVEVLQALQDELLQQQLQPGLGVPYPLIGQDEAEDAAMTEAGDDALTDTNAAAVTEAEAAALIEADEESIRKNEEENVNSQERTDTEEEGNAASQEQCDVTNILKEEAQKADHVEPEEADQDGKDESLEEPVVRIENAENDDETGSGIKVELEGEKVADFANPIPLSKQTVITVKGKKCVLSFDAQTQQVCAYPIKSKPGKRRGRPRMTEAEKVAARQKKMQMQMQLALSSTLPASPLEKSSAAETLLELSNTGADGIRRSGRARKKAKLLDDFEELDDSEGDEGPAFEDNYDKDPDIKLELPDAKQRRLLLPKKELLLTFSAGTVPEVKRGRGRPRRYPLPGQQNPPRSIPAVMLPSANGQTLVMAPIQDLQNLQQIRRQLPQLIPKPPEDSGDAGLSSVQGDNADHQNIVLPCTDGDPLPLDNSVLDSSNMIPQALQEDSIPLVGDAVDSSDQGDGLDTSPSSLLSLMASNSAVGEKNKPEVVESQPQQPTVIQIPDNLLASLGFKKDPVKIGLKASERELEKLKCPKCDFQGYYAQQYRNHIATHGDDILKCKCCSFITLDQNELLQHFKENHPRCICLECGYMAEHAYIIKRHMMRHDVKSCTCNICGKVYKDMYILKMHIKMVHMPAEVLFECDVCLKKFTRKAHLKRHMRTHEPEKPFKCPLCDYRGCERSDISKHMLIHQEPKHVCERCGKTFRHIKNKELHVKRHYGQRDYKCGVCDFFGYTFTDIRKHIERKHQDIKALICDKCGRHFRHEVALKEHQETCNVMMIEQVLAIPTSGGRTSQATIRIPTHHLSSLGGVVALDPSGTAGVGAETSTGVVADGGENHAVSIMVSTAAGDQHLGLVQAPPMEEGDEEIDELEEEEEDQDGHGIHLIDGTMLKEGEESVHHALTTHAGTSLSQAHLLGQGHQYVNSPSGIPQVDTSIKTHNSAGAINPIVVEQYSQQEQDTLITGTESCKPKEFHQGDGDMTPNGQQLIVAGSDPIQSVKSGLVNIEEWNSVAESITSNSKVNTAHVAEGLETL